MTNDEISEVLGKIADLLEIDGADRFRINSYRKASRTIEDCTDDVAEMAAAGTLTSLPGIGKSTAERITQYVETGQIDALSQLQDKLPATLPDLLNIQGLGPKKVAVIYRELGVTSIDDLKKAIASGKLAELSGFGATSVKRVAEGIDFLEKSSSRTPLGIGLPIAETLAERLRGLAGVKKVEIAGSIRRAQETIGDIDILCVADNGEQIIKTFVSADGARRILASGATKGSITVEAWQGRELQIDLRVVPEESFGAAMQYFTGSKEHNVRVREIAIKKGLRLNEYGLFKDEEVVAGETEEGIYEKLDLPWIPPEQRLDRRELDPGRSFDDLVTLEDIRGDLHMHTTASDGRDSIADMAREAKGRGLEYIAITDHSRSSSIANGLSIEELAKHIHDVKAVDEDLQGIRVFAGTECDILPSGQLDYPDWLLAECDCVIASIHSAMGKGGRDKLSATERTIKAIENPYVSIIGHPTGRLLGTRPPMDINMAEVIQAAAENKTALEVSASWQRLDLKDLHIRQAIDAGVMIVINTDAHSTAGFAAMHFGVRTARRAGATKQEIINCLSPDAFLDRIHEKRSSN